VTPCYLVLSACSNWCPCRVYVYFTGVLFQVKDSSYICQGGRPFNIFVATYTKENIPCNSTRTLYKVGLLGMLLTAIS
jgi:hypothetical protein